MQGTALQPARQHRRRQEEGRSCPAAHGGAHEGAGLRGPVREPCAVLSATLELRPCIFSPSLRRWAAHQGENTALKPVPPSQQASAGMEEEVTVARDTTSAQGTPSTVVDWSAHSPLDIPHQARMAPERPAVDFLQSFSSLRGGCVPQGRGLGCPASRQQPHREGLGFLHRVSAFFSCPTCPGCRQWGTGWPHSTSAGECGVLPPHTGCAGCGV